MALGGGTWLFQNKKLPGTYINFVSRVRASTDIADRGYATIPLELDWGPVGSVFAVTAEDFQERSLSIFGYAYTAPELKSLRDPRQRRGGGILRTGEGKVSGQTRE